MVARKKIDSNEAGLRWALEDAIGTLPGSGVIWRGLEPNSYADFGGQTTNVARNPINASRQRKKGVLTDLDASGGFNSDLTQTNLQDLMEGFFFADARRKGEEEPTAVDGVGDEYTVASTTGFVAGNLILASGFAESANNGLKTVSVVTTDTSLAVDEVLTAEASPPAGAEVVAVGFVADAGDLEVDVTQPLPAITSTTIDFTTLGLSAGEFIFVGADVSLSQFTNAVNNGWKRIRSVAANRLVIDKSAETMVTEAGGTQEVELFFGRVFVNEADPAKIIRRSYQLERSLGAPDTAQPSQIQAEYLVGAHANQLTLNFNTADKVTADLAFVATDHEQRAASTGRKTGTRPDIVESDAFNTSSDVVASRVMVVSDSDESPTALFGFLQTFTLVINNNISPNKAIGVLGAFDVTAGTFAVSGSITAYFSEIAAIQAVRANEDVTLDFQVFQDNAGVSVDVPLVALGDGRANVAQDEPITLPVSQEAASGAKVHPDLDHTLMVVFYDYLPDAAD